jgi:hypothetical protein
LIKDFNFISGLKPDLAKTSSGSSPFSLHLHMDECNLSLLHNKNPEEKAFLSRQRKWKDSNGSTERKEKLLGMKRTKKM